MVHVHEICAVLTVRFALTKGSLLAFDVFIGSGSVDDSRELKKDVAEFGDGEVPVAAS